MKLPGSLAAALAQFPRLLPLLLRYCSRNRDLGGSSPGRVSVVGRVDLGFFGSGRRVRRRIHGSGVAQLVVKGVGNLT